MPVFDIANNYETTFIEAFGIFSDGVIFGPQFDTANYDPGFVIGIYAFSTPSPGTDTITLQDNDGSGWVDIPDDKIITPDGSASIVIAEHTPRPGPMHRIAAFSNNNLVRIKITSADSSSVHTLVAILLRKPENLPADFE